ncbi:MAG: hypothetical protein J6R94_01995, partial [Agathobacter sp.]|nr:hypothetical protein [Agathobacter sp.]
DGVATDRIVLLVKDSHGEWIEREYLIEGSYIIFDFVDGEAGFALAEAAKPVINFVIAIAAVGLVVVVGAVAILVKAVKKKTSNRKK